MAKVTTFRWGQLLWIILLGTVALMSWGIWAFVIVLLASADVEFRS